MNLEKANRTGRTILIIIALTHSLATRHASAAAIGAADVRSENTKLISHNVEELGQLCTRLGRGFLKVITLSAEQLAVQFDEVNGRPRTALTFSLQCTRIFSADKWLSLTHSPPQRQDGDFSIYLGKALDELYISKHSSDAFFCEKVWLNQVLRGCTVRIPVLMKELEFNQEFQFQIYYGIDFQNRRYIPRIDAIARMASLRFVSTIQ